MALFFHILAWFGFLLSLTVHLAAVTGLHPSMATFWPLHIGIFIVFIPAILSMRTLREPGDSSNAFKIERCPKWMRTGVTATFVYAMLNFAVSLYVLRNGSSEIMGGKYVLSDHGHVVREITQVEYFRYLGWETRLFSGHWMMFYFWSLAGLRARMEKDKSDQEKVETKEPIIS